MASIRKIKGKFYARLVYRSHGRRKEKLIPLKTSRQVKAKRLLPQINQQEQAFKNGIISLEEVGIKKVPRIQPLLDEFMQHLDLEGRSPKTLELYEQSLGIFAEIFKEKDITLLGKRDYQKTLQAMRVRYENVNTINIHLRNIKTFLRWLVETDRLEKLPFKIKQLPVRRSKPRYFTDAEMAQILKEARPDCELYARIYVHWRTGLRLRELQDSFQENGFVKTFNPVKHGLEREIPVDAETIRQYQIAKAGRYHPDTVSDKFRQIVKMLGLYHTRSGDKRSFHCLRHTFAVRTYYQTRDIYRVKTLLGHSSVTTTEIYANFDISMLEQDFNREMKSNLSGAVRESQNFQRPRKLSPVKAPVGILN